MAGDRPVLLIVTPAASVKVELGPSSFTVLPVPTVMAWVTVRLPPVLSSKVPTFVCTKIMSVALLAPSSFSRLPAELLT